MANPSDKASENKRISDEASRWIVRLNSGEATAEDRRAAAAWREADPRHEAAFCDAEEAWATTSNLSQDARSGLARPGSARKKRNTPEKLIILVGLGLSAAFLAATMRDGAHDHATGTAEVRTVILPDGSQATLNARAAFDVSFSGATRRIGVARGEVFFEVAPDRTKPFIVETSGVTVTALGTAFLVRRVEPTNDAEVVVTQHAVEVASDAARQGPQKVRVEENQKVVIQAGEIGAAQPADVDAALSWRKGLLIAENKPLPEVIGELRRYHPGWIVIRGSALQELRVSAVLNLREPDASLDALATALPIRVQHISPYVVVLSSR